MVEAETIIIKDYSSLLSRHLKQRTILFENNNIYIRPLFYLTTIGIPFLSACLPYSCSHPTRPPMSDEIAAGDDKR